MPAPREVIELVERFDQYYSKYTSLSYNETQVRREFIDPFFKALGWDVDNTQAYDERYKEVIHEDAVKVGGKTKAPDYSFRIGGVRKFFVEAKKPAVNLKENPEPAYQLRRYAWSAKLPVSILTDFEEFIVYDCTKKPSSDDKSSLGRIEYYTYKDYLTKWDEIASKYSKQAIFTGKFDDHADSLVQKKGGKGTAGIDDAFLAEIEGWRDELAKNIALRNTSLSVRELNLAVQKIIDRIIFLRICEDRGIEEYGQLKAKVEGKDVYKNLIDLFLHADDKYNSGLFHFRHEDGMEEPDILTTSLEIDDKTLKHIVSRLYYPESPYEFSVIPADILGQVYEQFLGKVIRLTASHQAKIEEKPEVKKAGGVYYTPTYIVEYIVKNTIGKLVESKNPTEVSNLKFVDPACGSGSFLIGAYQYLLNWHADWYITHLVPLIKEGKAATDKEVQKLLPVKPVSTKKGRKKVRSAGSDYDFPIYQMSEDDWRLTSDEKKRILLNNIYGVDIDQQAVEVTKLSLLLKVLEGEKGERISKQLTITQERVLPSLDENIKCGNSLIGPDIYSTIQMKLDNDEEFYRINAFDWRQEFTDVFEQGGFDAVIGNPPYVRIQAMKEWAPIEVEFYKKLYESASKGNYDIYVVFVEKGLSLLNKDGLMGYILPHKFFTTNYGASLRQILSEGKNVKQIIHFGENQIFKQATTYTCLLFLSKISNSSIIYSKINNVLDWVNGKMEQIAEIDYSKLKKEQWDFSYGNESSLFDKLNNVDKKIKDICHVFAGTQTSAEPIFLLEDCRDVNGITRGYSKSLDTIVEIESEFTRPFLKGREIRKYRTLKTDYRVICPYYIQSDTYELVPEKIISQNYPLAYSYLLKNKSNLMLREKERFKGDNWYAYGYPKSMTLFQRNKIVVPNYNNEPSCTFDIGIHFFKTGYGILPHNEEDNLFFILGLLNSKLLFWYLEIIGDKLRGGYTQFRRQYLDQLPIRTIDFSNLEDLARHDRMVSLVGQMLELNKKLDIVKLGSEKEMIQRRINVTDTEIDKLVYELYELTDEEIAIVEGKVV